MAPADRGDAHIPPIAVPNVMVGGPARGTAPPAIPMAAIPMAAKPKAAATPDEFQIMRRIDKLLNQLPTEAQDRVAEWLRSRVGERQRSPLQPGEF